MKGNCYPEDIDCKKRIELLHKITDDPLELPKGEKSLKEYVEKLDKDSRTHWVDVPFTYMEKRMEESLAIITADAKEVLPLLQEKLRKNRPYFGKTNPHSYYWILHVAWKLC